MLINELAETILLDGEWEFKIGKESGWGTIRVPGPWEAQGYSKFVEGPAIYRRRVFIPAEWAKHRIQTEFDAVSYACTVFCNGVEVGSHRGLWTPFSIDLSKFVRFGDENSLELVIFKPGDTYPMRSSLAGFLPDVATTFGGLWQPARLRAFEVVLQNFATITDFDRHNLRVRCGVDTRDAALSQMNWQVEVSQGEALVASQVLPLTDEEDLDLVLPIPEPIHWSPAQPALYSIQVSLLDASRPIARATQRTGFRKMSADEEQLLFNEQPALIRGVLSWGWEPERIAPTYSREQAREEIRRVRAMGFNTIKLCLFIPNQTYFDVADEEGMLLWQELPMWLPEVTPELRASAPEEYREIIHLTRHHPSVALYSLGCELSQAVDSELLDSLNHAVRELVQDVLVCDNSGSGESYGGLDKDFADFTDYHPYCDIHYFEPLLDNWRRDWKKPRPWIFGEFCDSDTFRDLSEIIAANGGRKPWWMTRDNPVTSWRPESLAILEELERLEQAQTGFSPGELVSISHAQAYVIRKYTLESLRRRAGMGGYIITGLRDTPISTSGLWDDLNQPKSTAEEYLRINSDAVLSLDIGRRRRWYHGGDRPDRLDAHNFWSGSQVDWHLILSTMGRELPSGSQLRWSLKNTQGSAIAYGSSRVLQPVLPGPPREVGSISCQLPGVERATRLALEVSIEGVGFKVSNRWPVWVYPAQSAPPENLALFDPTSVFEDYGEWLRSVPKVGWSSHPLADDLLLTTTWDDRLHGYVVDGGKALLLQQGSGPLPALRCPFWREAIHLFPDHPLWESFPQHNHSDLQFFGLASDTAFDGTGLGQALPDLINLRPIMRRLDARAFQMSEYLFEARIGKGVLLGCSLRLQGGMGAQPLGLARNVAGGAMLSTLLAYLENLLDE